ncbi:MAG TPA: PocR ligand-binding domain-containing protein, partial [Candidatus Goldiibacteriota bacterium]|nr:PocR ligand-binding domain-containing protein [Candidatus Goldiibacteriota bacterium]
MAVESIKKDSDFDSSRLFNMSVWEGIQYKFAKDMGIAIKVMSENGNINIEESNFSDFYQILLSSPKGQKYVDIDINSFDKEAKFVNLYADCVYYNTSTYFYGEKFHILVGIRNRTPNPSIVKKLSEELELDYDKLLKAYNSIPTFNEERLISLSDFIVDLFNIVVELSVQEYTTQMANVQKEEEIAKMSALMEASIIINSTRNLDELLKIIMQSAEKV